MQELQTTTDLVAKSANEFWQAVGSFLPGLLAAILLIILGAIVAKLGEMVVVRVLELLGINKLREKKRIAKTLKETGLNIDFVGLAGRIVFWVIVIVFVIAAADVMGLTAVGDILRQLVSYVPNVLAAVIILTITIAGGRLAKGGVAGGLKQLSVDYSGLIGSFAQWAIVIFGTVLAIDQLGMDTTILTTNITIIVAGLMLAVGLAFGLGGRNHAERVLDNLVQKNRK